MQYKSFLKELYSSFQKLKEIELSDTDHFEEISKNIFNKISGPEIRDFYIVELEKITKNRFSFFAEEINDLRKDKDVNHYEFSISGFTCIIIFWIWENEIKISDDELYKLIEAILIGTLGYRIIDIQHDLNKDDQHLNYLGRYMIQVHQSILLKIFNNPDSPDIMNRYIEQYTIAEYLEKKNKWAGCPFSFEDPLVLGYKAAPFFYILELLARRQNRTEEYITNTTKGFLAFAAAIQMMDDVSDAKDDLQNGIESLSLLGYYKRFGTENINDTLIQKFLDHERTMKIFNTTDELFDIARECFSANDDFIFSLSVESYNERFHKGIIITN